MLAGLYRQSRGLTSATLWRPASPGNGRFRNRPFPEFAHGGILEPSRSATCCFFSTIDGIAKHFCHGGGATEEMDLKAVRLFFCAHLGIDAADICFG
jgi:hypothetical protein